MTIFWLIVLILYGALEGWEHIHPLMWWLLFPMIIQDLWDVRHKR